MASTSDFDCTITPEASPRTTVDALVRVLEAWLRAAVVRAIATDGPRTRAAELDTVASMLEALPGGIGLSGVARVDISLAAALYEGVARQAARWGIIPVGPRATTPARVRGPLRVVFDRLGLHAAVTLAPAGAWGWQAVDGRFATIESPLLRSPDGAVAWGIVSCEEVADVGGDAAPPPDPAAATPAAAPPVRTPISGDHTGDIEVDYRVSQGMSLPDALAAAGWTKGCDE